MTRPDFASLLAICDATWPPEEVIDRGAFRLYRSKGGGSRVRGTRLCPSWQEADLDAAEAAMAQMDQPLLFQVTDDRAAAALAARGYKKKDPTIGMAAPLAKLLVSPPPVTAFETWPIIQVQKDIWAEDGVGPDRIAVMERASCPKITLLGRTNDAPCGVVYAGLSDKQVMFHALYLRPAARRQGLGAHMLGALARWGQGQGADTLSLFVTEANTSAQAFYSTLGFERVGSYHYRILER